MFQILGSLYINCSLETSRKKVVQFEFVKDQIRVAPFRVDGNRIISKAYKNGIAQSTFTS